MAKILAVSIGHVEPLFEKEDSVLTAIRKHPMSTLENPTPIPLATLGFEGDEQADPSVHGGPTAAAYLYPAEHYPIWQTMRHQALKVDEVLPYGFMGENLTLSGLLETQVWVGDQLRIGPAERGPILVITRPRSPCFKFNAQMGFKHASKMMVQSAYTGWYCAVFKAGSVCAGDTIEVVPGERAIRIDEKHRLIMKTGQSDLF